MRRKICVTSQQHSVLTNQTDRKKLAVHDPVPFEFRTLAPADGMALHRLVRACPPLDPNSLYCNLLQCSHFRHTSIAAFSNGDLLGSITGYCIPERADTLFVWQVAVHPSARGQGLARTMLRNLLERMAKQGIRYFETSITPGNEASWKLFSGFAAEQHADMVRSVMFEHALHFAGEHETEYLFRIGPFASAMRLTRKIREEAA
jgi:L-2,4-diaminobutyric acid acetyltransferase